MYYILCVYQSYFQSKLLLLLWPPFFFLGYTSVRANVVHFIWTTRLTFMRMNHTV